MNAHRRMKAPLTSSCMPSMLVSNGCENVAISLKWFAKQSMLPCHTLMTEKNQYGVRMPSNDALKVRMLMESKRENIIIHSRGKKYAI